MRNDLTILLTIGRNVDGRPMSAVAWLDFKESLAIAADAYRSAPAAILGRYDGAGIWEGTEEDSAAILLTVDAADLPALDQELIALAESFGQECIGRLVHHHGGRLTLPAGEGSYVVGPSYIPSEIDGPSPASTPACDSPAILPGTTVTCAVCYTDHGRRTAAVRPYVWTCEGCGATTTTANGRHSHETISHGGRFQDWAGES